MSDLEQELGEFGAVNAEPVSRVQQYVAKVMTVNWQNIPHVTHNDEVDISALEELRQSLNGTPGQPRLTALPFLLKAVSQVLKKHPRFNASLSTDGKQLLLRQYCNIGVAVDTPAGLLVPVIKDCDSKSVAAIATELTELTTLARDKGLPYDSMRGGGFSISSLGSLGGTSFTPIINAPEVAILGITRAQHKACRVDGQLQWKLMLPLSLSYDHRVINGADAARFCRELDNVLAAPQHLLG